MDSNSNFVSDDLRHDLKKELNIELFRVGLGDKVKTRLIRCLYLLQHKHINDIYINKNNLPYHGISWNFIP